jgi:hypothetical protein
MNVSTIVKRLALGVLLSVVPAVLVTAQAPKAAPQALKSTPQAPKPKPTPSKAMSPQELAMAKPGPDPSQAIDEEYTKKIKEYTTETYFLSPIVDYMPASKTVPTPKAVLGDIAGAPGKLPYSKEVHDYMRLLEKSTPRVKVFSIGTSEEGREMIAVAIASDALMARLEQNRADLAKLADPRSIQMNDALADEIAKRAAPVYYITGTIHSTEAGSPTALMEMAYRLAVDESPYIRNIRENLITLITPIVEVDGRDRVVDMYEYRKKHPNQPVPDAIYWGHYVRHDNNRDAMALTLKLSQNVLDTYIGWKAQVLHDLHESVALLYDNTIGDGPYNAWLDPILTNEWQMIGWNNVNEMTRWGMPGVFAFGTFDTWSPGYLMFMAATHNGISRLYETFGNSASADTQDRTLSANDTSRTWYRQNPAPPRVRWSLRNNNNYQMTGILLSENYFANNRVYFLRNFYEKSKRSILKAKTEGPAAYVMPASDPRLGTQAELLRVLQKQGVEISRATSAFTVNLPVRQPVAGAAGGRGAGAGRGGAGAAATTGAGAGAGAAGAATGATTGAGGGAGAAAVTPPQTGRATGGAGASNSAPMPVQREFPAGSYIVRMDQPYSRIADALLDYQYWSPTDPQRRPYDDTGWTFPEGFGVQAVRITDPKVLEAPMALVQGTVKAESGTHGTGSIFAIKHNADNALITLRYRLKDADMQMAEEPFEAAGQNFGRGAFVIKGVTQADMDKAATELGLRAYALDAAPTVKTHPARAARVAILHAWSNTQSEGWWRQAFDVYGIPYDYIDPETIGKTADLKSRWDVIVSGPGLGVNIIDGQPMWNPAVTPYKNSPDMPNVGTWAQTEDIRPGMQLEGVLHLRDFVRNGGVIVAPTSSADTILGLGIVRGVTIQQSPATSRVVGSLLRTTTPDETSPIMYGLPANLAVYSDRGDFLNAGGGGGGRAGGAGAPAAGAPAGGGAATGGGRGGGPATRPTGRGTIDDPDIVQGRLFGEGTQPPATPLPDAGTGRAGGANNQPPLEARPRILLRFAAQDQLLVSGLLDGGAEMANQAVVVDVPLQKGHIVVFANNPIYRGETLGSYFMVFNSILSFDNLGAGRK